MRQLNSEDKEVKTQSSQHGEATGVAAFVRKTRNSAIEKTKHGEDQSSDGGVPSQFQTQFQQHEHVGNSTEIHTNSEVHWYHSDTRD